MMCKAFGVKITPEQAHMIEQLVPQIPAKLNEAGHAINAAIQNFDLRLRTLEENQLTVQKLLHQLMEAIEHGRIDTSRNSRSSGGTRAN